MQKIRIDFNNPGLPQHISAVENDSQSRFFEATLYENGKAYTAPAGAAYSIMYRGFGPQNQGWYDTINDGAGKRSACKVSGNVITCEIARQALQVPGHVSIVLCVTTGKGYMLKSWPIECDCKNDRYDSTAEIQSLFYITQVSNADWNRAIQAWENLKDAIDPTLSVSGKAADAAKVREAVNAEAERAKGAESQINANVNQVLDTLSQQTKNYWSGARSLKVSGTLDTHVSISSGTYCISAVVSSNTTMSICRIAFLNGTNQIAFVDIKKSTERQSASVVLSKSCDVIRFFSGTSVNNSAGKESTFADIQIETGDTPTYYIPHITATDFIARNDIDAATKAITSIEQTLSSSLKKVTYVGFGCFTESAFRDSVINEIYKVPVEPGVSYDVRSVFAAVNQKNPFIAFVANDVEKLNAALKFIATGKIYDDSKPILRKETVVAPDGATYMLIVNTVAVSLGGGKYSSKMYSSKYDVAVSIHTDSMSQIAFNTLRFDILKNAIGTLNNDVLEINDSFGFAVEKLNSLPLIVTANAMYVGDNAPTLSINTDDISSLNFVIGGKHFYETKQWRGIPLSSISDVHYVRINVPAGTTLYIKSIDTALSITPRQQHGIRLCSHLGYAGANIIPAFENAAMMGYPVCIANEQMTKDGIYVCCHDATINPTCTDVLTETIRIADKTYDELLQYNFGKTPSYTGSKLPTFEHFLKICSSCGMQPMLSEHGNIINSQDIVVDGGLTTISGKEKIEKLKELLTKYSLLSAFRVKANSVSVLSQMFDVFKNEIESYTFYDASSADAWVSDPTLSNLGVTVKKGIELSYNVFNALQNKKAYMNNVYNSNCFMGLYGFTRIFDSSIYDECLSYGVTEITDDYNGCSALNWR